ncbi:hypothetical protein P4O66_004141 [Electrophorus voltai]|uniref:Reverse transcriptase/retrotransposon-derived protein RNase H-like domain-containing protein n=1 Tax=Electrophorus voltai TaxID=2609070 RepID=A0AAD8YQC5_9TELE|nr:hypothetical protein P4O66_004141 [Electrophorus voltai]
MALSVFQAYINKVLREFLGRSVIANIDNILIYSPSRNQHVKQRTCRATDPIREPPILRFIRSFSLLAGPLTDQLWGPVRKIKWTQEVDKAFEELKIAFATAPIFQQPDPERPFVLEVDASDIGVGTVLSQHTGERGGLRPIA